MTVIRTYLMLLWIVMSFGYSTYIQELWHTLHQISSLEFNMKIMGH